MNSYNIAWSVGESSGEQMAASVMHAISSKLSDESSTVRWMGCAGPNMRQLANDSSHHFFCHQEDISSNGFGDVLSRIPMFLKYFTRWKRFLSEHQVDLLVLVDFSGFNQKLMKYAKKCGIQVLVIAPPQIWAWKYSRYKRYNDVPLVVTLPFEENLWKSLGCEAEFLGHPSRGKFTLNSDQSVDLLLCPGSRDAQVARSLRAYEGILSRLPADVSHQFQEVGVLWAHRDLRQRYESKVPQGWRSFNLEDGLRIPQAKWVWSNLGTMSLELALLGLPLTVVHPLDFLTYHLGKRKVHIGMLALPNILWGRKWVSEVIFWSKEWESVSRDIPETLTSALNAPYDELSAKLSHQDFATNCSAKILKMIG